MNPGLKPVVHAVSFAAALLASLTARAQPLANPSGNYGGGLFLLLLLLGLIYLLGLCAVALFNWGKPRIKKWVQGWKD
jgi:hypothetical protein